MRFPFLRVVAIAIVGLVLAIATGAIGHIASESGPALARGVEIVRQLDEPLDGYSYRYDPGPGFARSPPAGVASADEVTTPETVDDVFHRPGARRVPLRRGLQGVAPNTTRTVFREATPGQGEFSHLLTLDEAASAGRQAGIDMRQFALRFDADLQHFGSISYRLSGAPVRAPDGRVLLTFGHRGLASQVDAVETIAHELNHLRGIYRTGIPTAEDVAERSAIAAGTHFGGGL